MDASLIITVEATAKRGCTTLGFVLMVCQVADYDPTESRLTGQITLVTGGGQQVVFHGTVEA